MSSRVVTIGWRLFLALGCLLTFAWQTKQLSAQSTQQKTLRIAVRDVEPFAFHKEGELTGFSVELWNAIALELDVESEWIEVDSADEMIEAVAAGDADVGITSISITAERERMVDFSFPMFVSGLQILTHNTVRDSFLSTMGAIFSPAFLGGLGAALCVLLVVAHIVWFIERHENPDFHQGYLQGIWQAFYWAAVTATTIGYGDKVPRRVAGQIIALVWMLLSLFLVSYFTASVATELTLHRLQGHVKGPDDLGSHTIGTIEGSTSAEYLTGRRIPFKSYTTIDEMITALSEDRVEAVVYDAPVLQYAVSQSSDRGLSLVEPPFFREMYGIVLPENGDMNEAINQKLLEIQEDGRFDRLLTHWFGED